MAADRAAVAERLQDSTRVLQESMNTPAGIPAGLIDKAQCVVVIPGMKKGAFIIGANYGKGFASCRKAGGRGWTDPAALRAEGGSVGFQIGGQENDVVLFIMNQNGMQKLQQSKFTLGGDASVAAGPVGRTTTAQTDALMHAEILSWSRSRGAFAGIALTGATLRPDESDNQALYGRKMDTRQVFALTTPPPAATQPLLAELQRVSPTVAAAQPTGGKPATKATRKQR
jgi:lipid-binding SYLF domain-containing protein